MEFPSFLKRQGNYACDVDVSNDKYSDFNVSPFSMRIWINTANSCTACCSSWAIISLYAAVCIINHKVYTGSLTELPYNTGRDAMVAVHVGWATLST